MKIIYLANVRLPTEKAHGLQIMKMAEAFARAGINLELVIAKRFNEQFEKIDPFLYYGVEKIFPINKLWLVDLVERGPLPRKASVFLQNTSFAISAFFYLIGQKAEIIYSRDEFSVFLLSLFKKNLVLELHTFPESKKFLYKFIFKRLKKIVVITRELKKLVAELGIDENKIMVCPDGVDLEQFEISETKEECRRKLNLLSDKNIILYSGHLFAWKGVYVLAEASKFLSGRELIVMVGGMDYDREKLQEYIKENQLSNILLIGHQPPTQIPYYLKAADILVLPNSAKEMISNFYTSPMKLFEYMAAQRPIVASNLVSLREIIDSDSAILTEPDRAESLAHGVSRALNEPDLANNLVNHAFAEVKKYTWEKRAAAILNFIN